MMASTKNIWQLSRDTTIEEVPITSFVVCTFCQASKQDIPACLIYRSPGWPSGAACVAHLALDVREAIGPEVYRRFCTNRLMHGLAAAKEGLEEARSAASVAQQKVYSWQKLIKDFEKDPTATLGIDTLQEAES